MNKVRTNIISVILGIAISISGSTLIGNGPGSIHEIYAQNENETSEISMENAGNATTPKAEKLMPTPGEKTFYLFTSEVENVDEDKLAVAGDSFSMSEISVNKGDKVNVNFYNVDDVKTERHSFTIDDPYKVNISLAFGQNGSATFTADQTGIFTFYCAYHLPVMRGQLIVSPEED